MMPEVETASDRVLPPQTEVTPLLDSNANATKTSSATPTYVFCLVAVIIVGLEASDFFQYTPLADILERNICRSHVQNSHLHDSSLCKDSMDVQQELATILGWIPVFNGIAGLFYSSTGVIISYSYHMYIH